MSASPSRALRNLSNRDLSARGRVALVFVAAAFVSGFGSPSSSERDIVPATSAASYGGAELAHAEAAALSIVPALHHGAPPENGPPAGYAVVAEYAPIAIDELPLHRPPPRSKQSRVTKGELSRGETLASALRTRGIEPSVVNEVAREMRPSFDFRRAQPGHRFRLTQSPLGELLSFRYWVSPEENFHLVRLPDGFQVRTEHARLEPRITSVSGVVESSLYNSIRALGESVQLASDFAEIFAWDIDFSRSVRAGDDFQILYERLFRTDEDGNEVHVRTGRILAARYNGSAGDHAAIYFEPEEGHGSYFRPDGSSVERAFLVAPLKYSRISSRYSAARRHPILKVTRPHHGIDYAASEGAPVWAVADGTVIYSGWGGGFGNLVKIRHANGYTSLYAHLSRFAPKLRVGQQVTQKEVIGFVGQTGLATGPHVCFRVSRDGHYVNPLSIRSPAGSPISSERQARFEKRRDALLSDLDSNMLVAVDEAL